MENRKFGAIYSPADVRDYRIACASKATFPTEFELEMPEVKDQGNISSCVAHALSTVIEYFSRAQEDNYSPMSVGYIYGNRGDMYHKGEGMVTRSAIRVACKCGDIPEALFPYNEEVPTIIEKFEAVKDEFYQRGAENRLSTYFLCATEAEIKTALMKKAPVVVAMDWYSDMEVIDGVMYTAENEKDIIGGHCMVLYGWNETGWKIQNSWGTEWGNGGRFVLPYSLTIRESWGITDEYSQRIKIEQLETSNSELNTKIAELNTEINTMRSEQLSRMIELSRLQSEITKLSLEAMTHKRTIGTLESANNKLSEQLEEHSEKIKSLLNDVNTLTNDKEAAEEALSSGISKLNETINTLREQIENHKTEIEHQKAEIEAKEKAVKEKEAERAGIEEEFYKALAELETTLASVSAQLAAAEEMVKKQKAEIERLTNELIEIKKPYDSKIGRVLAKIFNFILNIVNR